MIETSLANLISNFSPSNLITFLRAKRLRNLSVQNEALSQFNSDKFTNIEKIAFLKFSDVEGLQFFTIKVTKDLTERSGKKAQFDLGKELLNHYDNLYDGIFVFYDSTGNFRFSLIYANYYGTRRKLSNFRRFTFFVSAKLTNKTFIMRMRDGDFSTLDGIKDAFSVEKVTKEFYQDISNWYDWALKTAKFPNDAIVKEKGSEMSVIRLITRMIFIWFMKVKGFISNDFFDETTLRFLIKDFENPEESTYYHAILQNLFFAILSKEVTKRRFRSDPGYKNIRKDYGDPSIFRYRSLFLNDSTYNEIFKNIPFLNGGLFTNLDVRKSPENPKEVFIDGFSDNQKNQALLPNKLFFGEDHQIDLNSEYGTKGKHYSVRGLIKTFELFNFTIDENTPDDQDIALDPELLGQVFENLLAKVNPETSEAARKETGSFYTPREIVDFMVDESLVAFFETAVRREIPEAVNLEERLKNLLDYQGGIVQFTKQETTILVQSIDSIKVLDPACGSGAFPMGMLNKLVYILGRLDPTNELWKDLQMTKALQELEKAGKQTDPQERTAREAEIERAFDQRVDSDYGRKLYLIRNAIYGVDIQPMAIQISKLRFFISLIVEQKMDLSVPDRNYGILPLPNLETKFVTANTLVHLYQKPVNIVIKPKVEVTQEVLDWIEDIRNLFRQYIASTSKNYRDGLLTRAIDIGHKVNHKMKSNSDFEALNVPRLFSEGKSQDDFDRYIPPLETQVNIQGDLFQGAIPELKEKLQRIHEQHFTASNETIRDYLEKEDARLRSSLRQQLQEQAALDKNTVRIAGLLSNWDPFDQNSVAGFFDPEWMFDVKDGFDIVIGNPPYIQLQKFSKSQPILQRTYANSGYETHDSMGDIYVLFYELGYSLLKWRTGILAFITSNKWMRAGYGKKLRDFFNIHTDPLLLIDFAGQRVFTTATVDVNIMILRKSKLGTPTLATTVKENCLNVLGDYIKQHSQRFLSKCGETWVILNSIEQGIKFKIENLGTPLSEWDIQINYGIKTGFNEAFIINEEKKKQLILQDPKSAEIIRPVLRGRDVKRYHHSFSDLWLINTHNGLKNKKIPPINIEEYPAIKDHLLKYYNKLKLRGDKGITPFNLRDCGYMEDFSRHKIIWAELARTGNSFIFDELGFYCLAGTFLMTLGKDDSKKICYPYLVSVLNNPLTLLSLDQQYSKLDDTGWQWKKDPILRIPIFKADEPSQRQVSTLYNDAKEKGFPIESIIDIDKSIFDLYDLTKKEISFLFDRLIVFRPEEVAFKKQYF